MTGSRCHYSGNRDHAIVSYLYGDDAEFDSAERIDFEQHVATCVECQREIDAFNDVRVSLAEWSPPDLRSHIESPFPAEDGTTSGHVPWWRAMPVWAQTAAAL